MTLRTARSSLAALVAFAALAAAGLCPQTASAQSFPQGRAPFAWGFFGHRHHRGPVVVYTQPAPVRTVYVPVAAPVAPVATPPSDENGYLVMGSTPLAVGQLVRASWGASYFPAQVTAVNADGTVGIHYVGYSDMWDETVPRTHLRLPR